MDPEVPEDRTEERGGQEHDHHHQSVAQVYTEGRERVNECSANIPRNILERLRVFVVFTPTHSHRHNLQHQLNLARQQIWMLSIKVACVYL